MIFSQPGFPPDLGTERGTKQPGFFLTSPNKKITLNQAFQLAEKHHTGCVFESKSSDK